ncbi:MAG TPA: hypothetical protein VHC19_27700 [Pirellulales bacterium]|nr:hypothetical protein [Pirellulales bacterium]
MNSTTARRRTPLPLSLLYVGLVAALAWAFIAKFRANDLPGLQDRPWVLGLVIASLAISAAGWIGVALVLRRVLDAVGVEGLATIGLISGLHFAVSYTAVLFATMLRPLFGPFVIFVTGLGDEGIPCLLLAVLITLLPRPGTLMLTYLTLFTLNCVFGGSFGLIQLLFVTISIALGEGILAAMRVTTGESLRQTGASPSPAIVWRMAVAVGLVNAAPLLVQYCVYQVMYRLELATWFIAAGTLIPGFLYGGIGAAIGTLLGFRLRRIAR